ncbi:PREDICTED: uncharacterized protein LOC108767647 [Trachymyrmex cornetzi]|uniref:uncharacterized protein LOC108767647 n=1 Tax=Trachymyrmex cornetzi TaxID=471704 RepID=UPI00084F1B1E|nr:PREDICTED: uncharacterized protein LOC108767647 [Trachymyrmex cornetzi]
MDILSHSIPILNNIVSSPLCTKEIDLKLLKMEKMTREFTRNNTDTIFTHADKGNTTVAIDRDRYIDTVNEMLRDEGTYTIVKKDPTKKLTKQLQMLLVRWKRQGHINEATYKRLYCSDGTLARAYTVPKIHKPNVPYRLIVSSIGSPLYEFASFLHKILFDSLPKADSFIKNSFDLVDNLRGIYTNKNYSLISLDVVSLFTNIPLDLALECVNDHWEHILKNCKCSQSEFVEAINLVLDSTYFLFDGTIYKQNFGTPMGSPLSPIVADLVMQKLEKVALSSYNNEVLFYYRYVDDLLAAVPKDKINDFQNSFNTFHPRLQFTLEVGDDSINFLDVTIMVNVDRFSFNWYRKPTFSGRYLNYLSNHPESQKRGIIFNLVDRAIFLSDSTFHHENIELIIDILINNDFPLKFIFDAINERVRHIKHRSRVSHDQGDPNDNSAAMTSWFSVPFIKNITDRFMKLNRDDLKVSFFSSNKINKFVRVHKDRIPDEVKNDVVYKISCNDCNATYVGQTSRQLKTRIYEHRNHIRWNTSARSVITDHRLQYAHDFDWNNVKVLDVESCYIKRLISEMLYIKEQENGINLQTDTVGLHKEYVNIINRL